MIGKKRVWKKLLTHIVAITMFMSVLPQFTLVVRAEGEPNQDSAFQAYEAAAAPEGYKVVELCINAP
ncbi:MAG: hypothetical protein J6X45_01565, partial [Lachnospiraceae bacterium]|nr:hypothetical protein [Lachnospiraceae bacterium]